MAYGNIWEIELSHEGLNKNCLIKGSDKYVVEQKAIAQRRTWDAEESTLKLESVLKQSLNPRGENIWDLLLNHKQFSEKKPVKTEYTLYRPIREQLISAPPEPSKTDIKYQPKIFFLEVLLGLRKIRSNDAHQLYLADLEEWRGIAKSVDLKNKLLESSYLEKLQKWEADKANFDYREIEKLKDWEVRKSKYEEKRLSKNQTVLETKNQYFDNSSKAISDYNGFILEKSNYPDYFPQEHSIDYQSNSKILIVDYALPDIDSLPNIKSVKYVATSNEFVETLIATSAITKLYDELLYQIALRTFHELYEADAINALDSIVFNGWVNSIDKSTGHRVNACIMSVNASKDEFMAINLKNVDPKACFKQLKGVGSAKLHGLSPIAPIMTINKQDKRFVSAYDVMEGVDESENLAAMDWQDFENLIREIFEKEFSSSGGEVKITQASRDGGVDAIAFDPDPIRGGKIVIQAKRYTNVVGVSAVRDLYGTTLNEGATKGILVTTANFGPDAYDFAKGKPLTLLNGSNLLHLLEKHGHKAKIDLKAAKLILADQKIS